MAMKFVFMTEGDQVGDVGPIIWPGGEGYLIAYGEWGDATLQLKTIIGDVEFDVGSPCSADTLAPFDAPTGSLFANIKQAEVGEEEEPNPHELTVFVLSK